MPARNGGSRWSRLCGSELASGVPAVSKRKVARRIPDAKRSDPAENAANRNVRLDFRQACRQAGRSGSDLDGLPRS